MLAVRTPSGTGAGDYRRLFGSCLGAEPRRTARGPHQTRAMIASEPHLKVARPALAQTGLVLVVDDYDDARFLVMCALHRSKLKCIGASTGEEALERVMADPEAIDAIVLDVMM